MTAHVAGTHHLMSWNWQATGTVAVAFVGAPAAACDACPMPLLPRPCDWLHAAMPKFETNPSSQRLPACHAALQASLELGQQFHLRQHSQLWTLRTVDCRKRSFSRSRCTGRCRYAVTPFSAACKGITRQ